MVDTRLLNLKLDYLISIKKEPYPEGLSHDQVMQLAMVELNSLTRCEYFLMFGDIDTMRLFDEQQKLDKGETRTKAFEVTVIEEPKASID